MNNHSHKNWLINCSILHLPYQELSFTPTTLRLGTPYRLRNMCICKIEETSYFEQTSAWISIKKTIRNKRENKKSHSKVCRISLRKAHLFFRSNVKSAKKDWKNKISLNAFDIRKCQNIKKPQAFHSMTFIYDSKRKMI